MKITAIVPWLVKSKASYWGEFLFVEVKTDEGISGWGEITTTTKVANRAVAAPTPRLPPVIRINGAWETALMSNPSSGDEMND